MWASDPTYFVLALGRDSLGVFSGFVNSCTVGIYEIRCCFLENGKNNEIHCSSYPSDFAKETRANETTVFGRGYF